MRVLVDIRHLSTPQPAGVGGYTKSLLHALFDIDKENEYVLLSSGKKSMPSRPSKASRVISNSGSLDFARDDKSNVSFFHIPISNKLLNLRTLLLRHPSLNWRVREPVDLLFLPNLAIATLPTDIPTVLTVHDLSWNLYQNFYSHKMQFWHKATRPEELITQSTSIIVPSSSTRRDLQRLYSVPAEKAYVVPHGVAPRFNEKMLASDHGVRSRLKLPKRFALFVGTIEPRKNLLTLIDGVKEYRERSHDDLHLVLIGGWGWRSHGIRRRLWKRDTYEWVHQIGYVDGHDLPAIYRSAQATVFPSIYEGFGLPILESMASGTPVITSHTSSMPEVGADASLYIDPYNSRDLSEALRGLLSSSSLHKQLRERGIARTREFTWEKTARQTLEVFNHVIQA
ncbi:glycosyltransferase family 4 protein [Candidatus Uhrbacteria bacterium]|nr:glycosyltransferase family 4 protein [Candidatus Uhrbacteria bacterium]